MKIIDLLNKIANGEEVPMFKYEGHRYEYSKATEMFDDLDSDDYCKSEIYFCELNDEVEILEEEKKDNFTGFKVYQDGMVISSIDYSREEEKKIPEKLDEFNIQGLEVSGYSMTQAEYLLEDGVKENREMINWILDYLKSKGDE